MTEYTSFIGIDASRTVLDVHVLPLAKRSSFDNDDDGVAELVRWLSSLPKPLVVLESSGGCELLLTRDLYQAGIPFAVVNPAQIRQFAKGIGLLAKNDALDAMAIARFAETVKPRLSDFPDPLKQELDHAVARRQQLVGMLVQEKLRLRTAIPSVARNIQKHIRWLEQQIECFERTIKDCIRNSPAWMERADLLKSMPGVGDITAFTLISEMPELGKLNKRQVASLAGLAPMDNESGSYRGRRRIRGGRSAVKRVMYMAAMTAIRRNPRIREFYQRLRQAGKPAQKALVACARKMLVTLNQMLRTARRYEEVTEPIHP